MVVDFKDLILSDLLPISDFEQKVYFFLENWYSMGQNVEVQTSGSTGVPKVFEIEKSKMRHSAEMTCNFLNLQSGNTALLCLPIEYISGKMMVVRSIVKGLKLIITNPSTKPLQDWDEEIDFCAMTPLQVENSLDKIHLIKKIIIGGAAVSENLKKKIYEALNGSSDTIIYETYGMSETLSHIALRQIFPKEEDYFSIFPGINISTDSRGCLKINAPQLNSEILQTNDIVELVNDRQFKFLGRADNIINSGGAKIFPEKLEELAKKVIDYDIVYMGINDELLGQKVVAVVESHENPELFDSIMNLKYDKKFHQPKEVIFLDEFPRTPNGKINRIQLKALL